MYVYEYQLRAMRTRFVVIETTISRVSVFGASRWSRLVEFETIKTKKKNDDVQLITQQRI
jgi:hypothetical protein